VNIKDLLRKKDIGWPECAGRENEFFVKLKNQDGLEFEGFFNAVGSGALEFFFIFPTGSYERKLLIESLGKIEQQESDKKSNRYAILSGLRNGKLTGLVVKPGDQIFPTEIVNKIGLPRKSFRGFRESLNAGVESVEMPNGQSRVIANTISFELIRGQMVVEDENPLVTLNKFRAHLKDVYPEWELMPNPQR